MKNLGIIFANFYQRNQSCLNLSFLVILCAVVFFNSLFINFLEVDDYNSILHNKSGIELKKLLLTNTYGDNHGGNYRPIEVLSHRIDSLLYGYENPTGRHLTNILIHILNVLLVYYLVSKITGKLIIGVTAASFFAVFVIHSYSLSPVSWISGRVDLFVTLFFLLSIVLFIEYLSQKFILLYFLSIAAFYLSLLSKEMAVTLPLIIILYSWLFLTPEQVNQNINSNRFIKLLQTLILGGAGAFILSFVLTPSFLAAFLSSDKQLHPETIEKIKFYSLALRSAGAAISFLGAVVFLLLKLSKQKFYLLALWYSIPYFIILFIYFVVRFFALGGFGGLYQSSHGGAVNFNFEIDAFFRDNLGLIAFFWPVGKDFYETILNLQVTAPTMFYLLSLLSISLVLIIFYYLIRKKQIILLFGFVWIFITLGPAHNILISPWYFNQRYLYLPSIGFCLIAAVLIYKIILIKNWKTSNIKYFFIALVLIFIGLNSFIIIKHNKTLRDSGNIISQFEEDIKRYQPFIPDTGRLVFLTYPLTPISTNGCVFVDAYKSDILYKINNEWNALKYNFLFFSKDLQNDIPEVNWIDKNSFTVELSNPQNYSIIPGKLSLLDIQIRLVHQGLPFHALLSPLPDIGKPLEVDCGLLTVLSTEPKLKKAIIRIDLTDSLFIDDPKTLFFSYQKGNWELINLPDRPMRVVNKNNFSSNTGKQVILIVEKRLAPLLDSALIQYKTDLVNEGYNITINSNFTSTTKPEEIRRFLQENFSRNLNLNGAVLIGHIPTILFNTIEHQGDPYWHDYLADFYFMDLDGVWKDTDNNGVFDKHAETKFELWNRLRRRFDFSDKRTPEIWVSRIRADKLYELGDEVSLIKNYFKKNHEYRTQTIELPPHRAFIVSAGVNVLQSEWGARPNKIYSDIDIVQFKPNLDDSLTKILASKSGYEWGIINAFSGAAIHHFDNYRDNIKPEWWDTPELRKNIVKFVDNLNDKGGVNYKKIDSIKPNVLFYHLLASEVGKHDSPNYLAGVYLFRGSGLCVIAGNQHSGAVGNPNLYESLAAGKSIGDSWKDALEDLVIDSEEIIRIRYSPSEIEIVPKGKSNYKAVLIGDGTLHLPVR
jgi:hypothetical protein